MFANLGLGRIPVKIEGYLTQKKLEDALASIIGASGWRGKEVRVGPLCRHRWDMVYDSQSGRVAVEFDGDEHYRNTLKIKTDLEKDEQARLDGYRVVRLPYWVRLTTEALRHFFNIDHEIIQDFAHGFITSKVFPASYCELGIARFKRELDSLPVSVREAVIASLRDRATEHGRVDVLPEALAGLLS